MNDIIENQREISTINKRIVNEIISGFSEIEKNMMNIPDNLKGNLKKIHGNLIAITIRKYLSNIFLYYGVNYKVSPANSYIKGSPVEWDLIVLTENAKGINNTNIYDAKDCICVLELKTSGIVNLQDFKKTIKRQLNHIKYIRSNQNCKLQFGYISFEETKKYFEETKNLFESLNEPSNNVFTFINYPHDKKIKFVDGCEDFEKYIFNLLENNKSNDLELIDL